MGWREDVLGQRMKSQLKDLLGTGEQAEGGMGEPSGWGRGVRSSSKGWV